MPNRAFRSSLVRHPWRLWLPLLHKVQSYHIGASALLRAGRALTGCNCAAAELAAVPGRLAKTMDYLHDAALGGGVEAGLRTRTQKGSHSDAGPHRDLTAEIGTVTGFRPSHSEEFAP